MSGAMEFSVYQFFEDGQYERVRSFVGAEEAVKAAFHYTGSVAVKLGIVDRVIITDGGDFTVFEWKRGEGVTFPEKENIDGMATRYSVRGGMAEGQQAGAGDQSAPEESDHGPDQG